LEISLEKHIEQTLFHLSNLPNCVLHYGNNHLSKQLATGRHSAYQLGLPQSSNFRLRAKKITKRVLFILESRAHAVPNIPRSKVAI